VVGGGCPAFHDVETSATRERGTDAPDVIAYLGLR
jgi:hypothetical protein